MPTPNVYFKIALVVVILLAFFIGGYYVEHLRFVQYKVEVEAMAKEQELHIAEIKKQQEITTKGIQDEYDAKLSAVRNYYKSTSVWNNSSSKMSGISTAPSTADVIASYNKLAEQCSETTVQLIELQKWINEQVGIK
jgi:hypothetical protein